MGTATTMMPLLLIAVALSALHGLCDAATHQEVLCELYSSSAKLRNHSSVNPCNSTECPSPWATCLQNSLVKINVTEMEVTGTIPDLSSLLLLRSAVFTSNKLVGTIPPLSNLSSLTYLNLGRNHLVGTIPPLPTGLSYLVLGINNLTGTIPPLPSSLVYIGASFNNLSGTIPSLPSSLKGLVLPCNKLNGTIPPLQSLAFVHLSYTLLEGTIPSLPSSLTHLYLSHTLLTGTIPSPLPSSLTVLDLSDSYVTGNVPATTVTDCKLNNTCLFTEANVNTACVSSKRASGCNICGPGNFSDTGAPPCTMCADGTASNFSGATSCLVKCVSGTYSFSGFTECLSCKDAHQNNTICPSGKSKYAATIAAAVITPVVSLLLLSAVCFAVFRTQMMKRKKNGTPSLSPLQQNNVSSSIASASLENLSELALESTSPFWKIEPASLSFSLQEKADIDVPHRLFFTLFNCGNDVLYYSLSLPTGSWKFSISSDKLEGSVELNASVEIQIVLTLNCTAMVCESFPVYVSFGEKSFTKKEFRSVKFTIDGKLSDRIDYDELEFKEVVGKGGFGIVYRGFWRGNEVAIKQSVEAFQTGPKHSFREVEILGSIRCPWVVSFFGSASSPKGFCLVTEFISNGSLAKALRKYSLSDPFRIRIALNIAQGMKFLHCSNILHRDLKPENVLVVAFSMACPVVCKLTDFGTSRTLSTASQFSITKGVGTPLFMAPEVLSGKNYQKAADVFSFGMLLNEMWLAPISFTDSFETIFTLMSFIMSGKRPEIPGSCCSFVKQLIERCWDQNPDSRPSFDDCVTLLTSNDSSDDSDAAIVAEIKKPEEQKQLSAPAPETRWELAASQTVTFATS